MAGVDSVPLSGLIRIERELHLSVEGLEKLFEPVQVAARTGNDLMELPDLLFTIGVLVWMARLAAGERIGFEDACDFPATSISVELTDEERAEAAEREAAAKAIAEQPGVRPTSAVPATADA